MVARLGARIHDEMRGEYPPELLQEFDRLMEWVDRLTERFGRDAIRVRVVDPQSPEGLWKCLRHRVRRYPTFILPGGRKIAGWDWDALIQALEQEAQDEAGPKG